MTPNTIEFRSTSDNTWVMRITADRKIEVNEDVDVTFAAQKVLDAMQGLLTPQRTWVGLMRGVRVEGDTLVIKVKGGNDAARELCGALIEEMNK